MRRSFHFSLTSSYPSCTVFPMTTKTTDIKTTDIKRTPQQVRNIKRWVKALRSGAYKQANGALCQWSPDGTEAYCCLGVAANELLPGEWIRPTYIDEDEEFDWAFTHHSSDDALDIDHVSGILEQETLDHLFGPGLNADQLASMNDGSWWCDKDPDGVVLISPEHKHTEKKRSFRGIAQHIERVTGVKA